ncbi:unnamed protein product [Symbiodinium pilosum]|uniref:Uncharacterized protein n=1 Tax=Symbiodinium pilosum TaxID=2952 RepID=A0A812K9P0_SYMPI|nr:unnamed protein product [Symbiodinium pilosum]
MGGERDAASAVLASDCRRPESEPSHLPDDLRHCKFPNKTDQFGTAPWTRKLVNNPYEPGCWDRTSYCAPFECFPQCRYNVEYQNMITYWAPFRPGKRKVMVFQYGKVASTAIVRGLKLYAGITAAHVHTADHAKQWLAGRHVDLPVEQQGFALSEEWSLRSGDACTIITATRSHFSRDVSEYFENILQVNHPYGYHPRGVQRHEDRAPRTGETRWTQASVVRLGQENISALVEDYRAQHSIVLAFYAKWFTRQFKAATGLDVLSQPFDLQQHHSWIQGSRCSALVLRSEDSKFWPDIIAKYFDGFKMPRSNAAGNKWYSGVYSAFKTHLQYSVSEMREMCATETERHFYREEESSPCKW